VQLIPTVVVLDPSCAGLTRASIEKSFLFKTMDCRVKPGNDEGESASTTTGIRPPNWWIVAPPAAGLTVF
jgi:hypothetical protein